MSAITYPEPRRFTSADVPANIPGVIFHERYGGTDLIGVQRCDNGQSCVVLRPCGGFDEMTVKEIHEKYQRRLWTYLEVFGGTYKDTHGDIPVERSAFWVSPTELLKRLAAVDS